MNGDSRIVTSAQEAPHRDLETLVRRHAEHPYLKPILEHNRQAFIAAMGAWWSWKDGSPLVLDAGCGVGWSTLKLAEEFPDHFVIGVDQSLDRLSRGKPQAVPDNVVFVRADLVDFWRLLRSSGVRLDRHYLLYPNPWPKIGHLARRWHGHPVFPTLLALGGRLECRSNWEIYVTELAQALHCLTGKEVQHGPFVPEDPPLTPFEAKYLASGQPLYRLAVKL
ncbi:MAG: tRNA (guanine(46)-N(7))-methyltransferase TrmB [Betaproteobacteria bacterium]